MSDIERFWSFVDRNGPVVRPELTACWVWTGKAYPHGYGMFGFNTTAFAHRASWMINRGPIPRGMCVMHACDNRLCVNPDHLSLGSHKDNMQDAARKQRTTLGTRNGQATLTDEKVLAIRVAVAGGETCFAVAERFGIARRLVGRVADGSRWPHVGGPITRRGTGRPLGVKDSRPRVST